MLEGKRVLSSDGRRDASEPQSESTRGFAEGYDKGFFAGELKKTDREIGGGARAPVAGLVTSGQSRTTRWSM